MLFQSFPQKLSHTEGCIIHTEVFTRRTSGVQKLLHTNPSAHTETSQIYPDFGHLTLQKACWAQLEIRQFWAIESHFARKGCAEDVKLLFLWFLTMEPRSWERVAIEGLKSYNLRLFLTIEPDSFVRTLPFRGASLAAPSAT